MGEKGIAITGTIFLVLFNLLAVLIGVYGLATAPLWAIIGYSVVAGGSALYFDFLAARYFVQKIKEKLKK